jgi:hypothetical protein
MDNPTCNLCGSEKVSLTLTCHEPACAARQHPSPHVPALGPKTAPFPHAWQCRVVDERAELDEKIKKLGAFIDSREVRDLPMDDLVLLFNQHQIMRRYSDILGDRIKRFGRAAAKVTAEMVSIRGIVGVTGEAEISNEVDVLQALKVAGAVDVHVAYNPRDFGWVVACMGPADLAPVMPKGVTWQRQ